MRNPKRIRPFLKELEILWEKSSDLRFGQLIYSLNLKLSSGLDTFNVEDNEYLQTIKNL